MSRFGRRILLFDNGFHAGQSHCQLQEGADLHYLWFDGVSRVGRTPDEGEDRGTPLTVTHSAECFVTCPIEVSCFTPSLGSTKTTFHFVFPRQALGCPPPRRYLSHAISKPIID